jgi:hypothetical protein
MNDWICLNCKSINRAAAQSCYSCGTRQGATPGGSALDAADGVPGMAAGAAPTGGASMAAMPYAAATDGAGMSLANEAASLTAAPSDPATAGGPMDLAGGLIGGVIGAVLATAVWYGVVAATQFQVGLVAIAVGWLVAQAVVFGAQRRFALGLIPISVILTLLALTISEYLIVAHFVSLEFGAVEVIQPPAFVVEIVVSSLQADPLTLAFWAIALFQAFVIPARLPRPQAGQPEVAPAV